MQYRPGTKEDLDEIGTLIKKAIELMDSHGIHQWDELYPTKEVFLDDINKNTLYVAVEDERIIAVHVFDGIYWRTVDHFLYHRFFLQGDR
jgi:hypothetical protein